MKREAHVARRSPGETGHRRKEGGKELSSTWARLCAESEGVCQVASVSQALTLPDPLP